MQTLITGGTGFVGRYLSAHFAEQGHRVTVVGTRERPQGADEGRIVYLQADTTEPGDWQEAVAQADAIVNLTGKTIFRRWTKRYRRQIYDTRILTTRHIVSALPEQCDTTFISTSAVGYYGDGGDQIITEGSPKGNDFLAELAKDWEGEALQAASKGARVVLPRFGIVLGADGGALAKMLPAFRRFAGGPIGTGRQWFPWIHIDDLVGAYQFFIDHDNLEGPFNLCSPGPVRNGEFAKKLGQVLGRPAVLPVPGLALKLALGEMAEVLLSGQRAVPAALSAAGFEFRYPDVVRALEDLAVEK